MFIARTENRLCDTKICWALFRFLHSNPDEKKNIFDLSKCCYSASDPPHCLKVFVIHIAWKLLHGKVKPVVVVVVVLLYGTTELVTVCFSVIG